MPRSSVTSDSGGIRSAPNPRDRKNPSSTRKTGAAGCSGISGAALAQAKTEPPCCAALFMALVIDFSNFTGASRPKTCCSGCRFHSRMPVAMYPRWSARQAPAWTSSAAIACSISQSRSW